MAYEKCGIRVKRGVGERQGVRNPFGIAVTDGRVPRWENSAFFRSVKVGTNDTNWTQEADLVLVHSLGKIGIVECKLARNNQSRHGMIEQALLYCELVRKLSPRQFKDRLYAAKPGVNCPEKDENLVFEWVQKAYESSLIIPILIVDRWGSAIIQTTGITLDLINEYLPVLKRPKIEVYALGSKAPLAVNP